MEEPGRITGNKKLRNPTHVSTVAHRRAVLLVRYKTVMHEGGTR